MISVKLSSSISWRLEDSRGENTCYMRQEEKEGGEDLEDKFITNNSINVNNNNNNHTSNMYKWGSGVSDLVVTAVGVDGNTSKFIMLEDEWKLEVEQEATMEEEEEKQETKKKKTDEDEGGETFKVSFVQVFPISYK